MDIDPLTPKPPSASLTETVQLVFPEDANPLGTVFGGRVMQWVDAVAAMAAQRHCRRIVVTAAIDAVAFRAAIRVGEYAVLQAWVNRTWHTSLEVEVTVDAEHPLTGERRRSVEAFLTFAAIGDDGRPTQARPVMPQTELEWQRYHAADRRRAHRLAARAAPPLGVPDRLP
jgi:acyl-CoA hydrolase